MNSSVIAKRENPLATLARWAKPKPAVEQCEFCSLPLSSVHRHVMEIATLKIVCACDPCALRFENVAGRWKLIPREARVLPEFQLTDAEWDGFALPINLAFFFRSSRAEKVVAMYPSPAGATESLLPLATWNALVAANPSLGGMDSDVEALLVNRLGDARDYYLAPMDLCFELVGTLRLHWRGLSGGEKVWSEIEKFFARLRGQLPVASGQKEELVHA